MRVLSLVVVGLVGCSAGREGPPGLEGLPGERGSDGAPGTQGERGPLGPPGDRGTRGDEGIRGETGEQGERGEQGAPGPVGSVGPQGLAGSSGADGTSCFGESTLDGFLITCGDETFVLRHGEDGESGAPGSPGPMGLTGPKGDRGEIGPRGEQGSAGSPGRDGASCIAQDVLEGIQISCGNVSVLIRHGEHGPQGERGEPGLPGADAQEPVPQCPDGAEPLEVNGHLIYCARRLVFEEPQTYAQCYADCLGVDLYLVDTDDLVVICLSNPDFFDDEIIDQGEGGVVGTCGDGLDNDADGRIDCNDNDCAGSIPACIPGNRYHITYRPGEPYNTPGCVTNFDNVCRGVERNINQGEFINWGFYISEIGNPPPKGCLCGKRL